MKEKNIIFIIEKKEEFATIILKNDIMLRTNVFEKVVKVSINELAISPLSCVFALVLNGYVEWNLLVQIYKQFKIKLYFF